MFGFEKKKKMSKGIESKENYGIYGTLHSWPLYLFSCSFLSFKAIFGGSVCILADKIVDKIQ